MHRKPALFSFAFAASCQAQQTHPVAARHPSRGLVKERKGAKEKIFWKLGEDARLQVCCFLRWTAEGSSRTASVRLHKGCAVQPLEKPPDGLLGAGKMLRPLLHQNLVLNTVSHWLGGEEPLWQHVFKMVLWGLPAVNSVTPVVVQICGDVEMPDSHWSGASHYFPVINVYGHMTKPVIFILVEISVQEALEISSHCERILYHHLDAHTLLCPWNLCISCSWYHERCGSQHTETEQRPLGWALTRMVSNGCEVLGSTQPWGSSWQGLKLMAQRMGRTSKKVWDCKHQLLPMW